MIVVELSTSISTAVVVCFGTSAIQCCQVNVAKDLKNPSGGCQVNVAKDFKKSQRWLPSQCCQRLKRSQRWLLIAKEKNQ